MLNFLEERISPSSFSSFCQLSPSWFHLFFPPLFLYACAQWPSSAWDTRYFSSLALSSNQLQHILSVVCVYIIAVTFTFTVTMAWTILFYFLDRFALLCTCVCVGFFLLMFLVSLYNCVLQTGPATKWLCSSAQSNVQVSCRTFQWTNAPDIRMFVICPWDQALGYWAEPNVLARTFWSGLVKFGI